MKLSTDKNLREFIDNWCFPQEILMEGWMSRRDVIYIKCIMDYYSAIKKKGNLAIYDNMVGSWGHYDI